MKLFGVPFRLDFCQRTVHFRPPETGAPNSTFHRSTFPKHLKPARQRALSATWTLANAPVAKAPPFNEAGWSQVGKMQYHSADAKKFASEHRFVVDCDCAKGEEGVLVRALV